MRFLRKWQDVRSVLKALSVIFTFEICMFLFLKYLIGATMTPQNIAVLIVLPLGMWLLVLTLGFELLEQSK